MVHLREAERREIALREWERHHHTQREGQEIRQAGRQEVAGRQHGPSNPPPPIPPVHGGRDIKRFAARKATRGRSSDSLPRPPRRPRPIRPSGSGVRPGRAPPSPWPAPARTPAAAPPLQPPAPRRRRPP